jgi:hypothetical protein
VNRHQTTIRALLSLLQDDDEKIASLAMEQFLKLDRAVDETIAEHQESQDPRLRNRIHQLSSILARRRARREFIHSVADEGISLWDGVVQINALYDPQCDLRKVREAVQRLSERLGVGTPNAPRLAALMRDEEFTVPDEDGLDIELFLAERVLETKYGSSPVLCALAQRLGELRDWESTIVLYDGRFCLMDRHQLLMDPAEGWHIAKMEAADRVHPCARKNVWLGILTQCFLVSLVDGQLRDLYHFGDLLTTLNGTDVGSLPYPLGQEAGAEA